jgi:DNA-binding winged helix-turn-helix (wHTH) protein
MVGGNQRSMTYLFRDLEIDEESFSITRGSVPVAVEPRVFELLVYLLRHRDRMVPRAELLEGVWRGYSVGESAIARCVCLARQLLGQSSAIRTIYGRGYRWVAPITCLPSGVAKIRSAS